MASFLHQPLKHIYRLPADLPGFPEFSGRGVEIGHSRGNLSIEAFRLGRGKRKVSLIGGCHADEPVGPSFLRKLLSYLHTLDEDHPLIQDFDWWIIPHLNPDGELINRPWWLEYESGPSLGSYLKQSLRELPGDDIEFGFPREEMDFECRPENRAAYDWWKKELNPFALHISFHGMGFAAGPWYLVEKSWEDQRRLGGFKNSILYEVCRLNYRPHDVQRNGEKGFFRLGEGFCSRPDSREMKYHFLQVGDLETGDKFRPSSMESILSFGGDPFVAVSEMPLFILPDVARELGPPDPAAKRWRARIDRWRLSLKKGIGIEVIDREAEILGLKAMSVIHQQHFQAHLLQSSLNLVHCENTEGLPF